MATREEIDEAVSAFVTKVLLLAQAALPEHQFAAYRRLVLDAHGRQGLRRELDRIFSGDRGKHAERNGPDHTGRGKGGAMRASGP
jgi:hypothetical protein